jgi:hypothetical protein
MGEDCYRGFCIARGDDLSPPVMEPAEMLKADSLDAGAADASLDAISDDPVQEDGAAPMTTQPLPGAHARSDAARDASQKAIDGSAQPTQPVPSTLPVPQSTVDASTPPPQPQVINCDDTKSNCKPECGAGAMCEIACGDVSNCEIVCAGRCVASCTGTDNCLMRCQQGATCELDCRSGEGNCEKIRCERGASCLLRCAGREHCEFERCEGMQRSCPNGDIACDHACP